ncbi:MAG: VanW family protein [Ruminococcus sp.]|nr:VanW family protein [Ruminococcus sp.]
MENNNSSKYNFETFSNSRSHESVRRAAPRRTRSSKSSARRSSEPRRRTAPTRTAPRHSAKPAKRRKPPMNKGKKIFVTIAVFILVAGLVSLIGVVGFNMYREYKKSLPFRFSEGVSVAGIDISYLSYKDAKAKLEENSMNAVKDIKLSVTARNTNKTYSKEDFEYNFDYDTPLNAAKIYSLKEQGIYEPDENETTEITEETTEKPEFTLSYEIKEDSIKNQVKKLAKEVNANPKNAKISKFHPFARNRFEYKKGVYGYTLHQENLTEKLTEFFSSGKSKLSVKAEGDVLKPEITVNDLRNNIVGLSTASSVSTNTENGTSNMRVALEACNGSVIEPGAIWSFNDCTGDSNLESNGYKKAAVISEKKLKQGVGGGICQASTLIFEAGLFANMDIIERHNHYWASSYAYAGEDATIDYPNLDLRMQNTTDYQMFIECKVEGRTLRVNIWGYQDPSYDNIRLHSENYDVKKKNFRTRTFRELFKDGEIIKTETICNSYYNIKNKGVVKTPDTATYRTTVNGVVKYETAQYETMPENKKKTKKSKKSEENTDSTEDNSGENNTDNGEE